MTRPVPGRPRDLARLAQGRIGKVGVEIGQPAPRDLALRDIADVDLLWVIEIVNHRRDQFPPIAIC